MVNLTGVNLCPPPFVDSNLYLHSKGCMQLGPLAISLYFSGILANME